jgi:hypothetical protein
VIVHLVWGFLRLFLLISDPANSEVIFAVESEIGISGFELSAQDSVLCLSEHFQNVIIKLKASTELYCDCYEHPLIVSEAWLSLPRIVAALPRYHVSRKSELRITSLNGFNTLEQIRSVVIPVHATSRPEEALFLRNNMENPQSKRSPS